MIGFFRIAIPAHLSRAGIRHRCRGADGCRAFRCRRWRADPKASPTSPSR